MIKPIVVVLAVVLIAPCNSLRAQANADSIHHRNNCRLASQVLLTGKPAPRTEWAWSYIDACSPTERTGVYRHAVQQAAEMTDLDQLHRAVMPVVWFRDGRLFEDVLELAAAADASVPARVVAFVALASLVSPTAAPSYSRFTGAKGDVNGIPVAQCSGRRAHGIDFTTGPQPMPGDYLERIRAVARQAARDGSLPRDVRSAAACTEF